MIVAAVLAVIVYIIIKIINVQSSRFEKKDDSKLREEISHDTPDKDPDDIVIPDDITEEEKQKLQEEKEYWTAVKDAKKLIAEKVLSSALPD